MRYIVMHKVDANMEAGTTPNQGVIIEKMGQLIGESIKAGTFLNGAGLHPSSKRVRLEVRGGKSTATKGPLTGRNELLTRIWMVKTSRGMSEAIELGERFAMALGDVEIDIGPVVEPWDIGIMPKPKGEVPERFLLLLKSDGDAERGAARAPAVQRALDALEKELTAQGVLLAVEQLAPSKTASRLPAGGRAKKAWVDGPFIESKEMIAGFSILELPSKAEAIAWAERYADILGVNEVDVRELAREMLVG